MIAKPPHNRKLTINGIALTKARNNKLDYKALAKVRDDIEKIIITSNYLEEAPFSWVTLAILYGLKNDETPNYQPINKKYGDLPLTIEVDTNELINASIDELEQIFKTATLRALLHAGEKYCRPRNIIENLLKKSN